MTFSSSFSWRLVVFVFCLFQFIQISISVPALFPIVDLLHQQPFLFQSIVPAAGDAINSLFHPISDVITKITGSSPFLSSNDLLLVQEEVTRLITGVQQELLAGIKSNTVDLVNVNKIQSSVDPVAQYLLNSYDKFLNSDPRLKLSTDQGLSLIIKDDIIPQLNALSQKIYNDLLGADPRLNLKTNEYTSLVIKDDLLPWIQTTKEKINNGPLFTSIRNTISGVSQQVVSSLSQGLDEGVLKPVGGALSAAGNVDVQKLVGDSALPSAAEFNNLVLQKVQTSAQVVLENVAPSLDRFVVNFGAGLAKSGAKLSENLQGLSDGTSIALERISTRMNQPRTINLEFLDAFTSKNVDSTASTAPSVLQEVQAKFQSKFTDLSSRLGSSQFFVPPDVVKGETWVQQSAKFLESLKNLKQEDVSQLSSTVASSLDALKSQALANPKLQDVGSLLKQVASGELVDAVKTNLNAVGGKGAELGASGKAALEALASQAAEVTKGLKTF